MTYLYNKVNTLIRSVNKLFARQHQIEADVAVLWERVCNTVPVDYDIELMIKYADRHAAGVIPIYQVKIPRKILSTHEPLDLLNESTIQGPSDRTSTR